MDYDGWRMAAAHADGANLPINNSVLLNDFSELLASLGVKHQFYPYTRERDGKVL